MTGKRSAAFPTQAFGRDAPVHIACEQYEIVAKQVEFERFVLSWSMTRAHPAIDESIVM